MTDAKSLFLPLVVCASSLLCARVDADPPTVAPSQQITAPRVSPIISTVATASVFTFDVPVRVKLAWNGDPPRPASVHCGVSSGNVTNPPTFTNGTGQAMNAGVFSHPETDGMYAGLEEGTAHEGVMIAVGSSPIALDSTDSFDGVVHVTTVSPPNARPADPGRARSYVCFIGLQFQGGVVVLGNRNPHDPAGLGPYLLTSFEPVTQGTIR